MHGNVLCQNNRITLCRVQHYAWHHTFPEQQSNTMHGTTLLREQQSNTMHGTLFQNKSNTMHGTTLCQTRLEIKENQANFFEPQFSLLQTRNRSRWWCDRLCCCWLRTVRDDDRSVGNRSEMLLPTQDSSGWCDRLSCCWFKTVGMMMWPLMLLLTQDSSGWCDRLCCCWLKTVRDDDVAACVVADSRQFGLMMWPNVLFQSKLHGGREGAIGTLERSLASVDGEVSLQSCLLFTPIVAELTCVGFLQRMTL